MKKNLKILFIAAFALAAFAAAAADLSIDYQMNVVAADAANNYLTYQGKAASAAKDQFDAVSGASKLESTAMLNVYRYDIFGGKLLPAGLRGLLLYPVADDATRTGDGLKVTASADGAVMIRYCHRGTANQITTFSGGRLMLPTVVQSRKIGHSDNQISTDFSPTGKVADIDWGKVWDESIADGKVVGTTTSKTGKVTEDSATSNVYIWTGTLAVTFDGTYLKMKGDLNAVSPVR